MGQCTEGCGKVFPGLPEGYDLCMKCKKIQAAKSETEKNALKTGLRSCQHCSAAYPNLDGDFCGPCAMLRNDGGNSHKESAALDAVHTRVDQYDKGASALRLNQHPKQNSSLSKANTINKQMANMRATVKAEHVHLDCSVHVIKEGGVILKSKMPPVTEAVKLNKTVNEALASVSAKAVGAFTMSAFHQIVPVGTRLNPSPALYGYAVGGTGKSTYTIALDDKVLQSSIDDFFEKMCKAKTLTLKDQNDRRIPLCLTIPLMDMEFDEDDDDAPAPAKSTIPKKRKGPASSAPPKTQPPPPQTRTSRYSSKWNPKPKPKLEYTTYKFEKSIYQVDQEGNAERSRNFGQESLEISKDWVLYGHGDTTRREGYLGSGMYKFAFKGRYGDQEVAVLQNKKQSSTNQDNMEHLDKELKLLQQGQWFAKSFQERAQAEGAVVPSIKWNSDGAFLAHLTLPTPADDLPDVPLFDTILVVPLLQKVGLYKETRFSGNEQVGNNRNDRLGMAIDAFAHHVVEDTSASILFADLQGIASQNSAILFDPQTHTKDGDSGPWDNGINAIQDFCLKHNCNDVCSELNLSNLAKFSCGSGPIRIGF